MAHLHSPNPGDKTPVDLELKEYIAELEGHVEELAAIIARHAKTVEDYGLDFTDTGHLIIVDRWLANTSFTFLQEEDDEREREVRVAAKARAIVNATLRAAAASKAAELEVITTAIKAREAVSKVTTTNIAA